jgi:hypothetical protein
MAGLLDYIVNSMSGGQMSQAEKEAALYAKRADTSAMPTRGEATPADLMRVMSTMRNASPTGAGMMTAKEGAAMNQITMPPTSNIGQMTELEALRLQSLKNALPYSLSRPSGAWQAPQNTMQNIDPMIGGMTARNAQPPMDLNMLLRLLGR